MDISETFRAEDISKTDLFDFVVNSSDSTTDTSLPHFGRSLKSYGIYLEAANNSAIENNINNSTNDNDTNNISDNNNNNNSANNEDCEKLISIDGRKERNNNNLLIANGSLQYMDSTSSYWSTTTVTTSKDDPVVRWEHSMLEDLNCWSQENTGSNSSNSKHLVCDPSSVDNNTDGAIYTLTVLNGNDQNSTWYRLPETTTIHHENDDSSTNQNHQHHHAAQLPDGTTTVTPSIDFDSLLSNIIPSSIHQQTNPSSFSSFCPVSTPEIPSRTNSETNTTNVNNSNNTSNEPTSPIKSDYLYEDNNYPDNKSCGPPRINFNSTPTNENHSSSNPEWKSTTESTPGSSSDSRVNSLLRNALQGKSNSFSSRYNGSHTHQTHLHAHPVIVAGKSDKSLDGIPPTSVAISTCKEVGTAATATSGSAGYGEIDESIKTHSPLMAVSLEGGTVVMFDGGSGSGSMIVDSDNPSSAQSMDDIFLSHLDTVTYAEDYEKLKSIENEVAKSVEQYCTNPYLTTPTSHITTNEPIRIPSMPHHLDHTILNAIPSTTSSQSKNSKKFGKRSSSATKTGNGPSHHQLHQTAGSSSGTSSSSGGGIRKERSLHYCNICHKGFKDKYSVNVHIRTHTGEKPFTCTFCGKNFRQKAHLAKHHHTHSVQKNAASNVSGNSTKPQNSKHR